MSAMIERLRHPELPARDILLDFQLIVRASSGGKAGQAVSAS
jgi:DNA-binding LacI/PurR family transcriptional regulator